MMGSRLCIHKLEVGVITGPDDTCWDRLGLFAFTHLDVIVKSGTSHAATSNAAIALFVYWYESTTMIHPRMGVQVIIFKYHNRSNPMV